MHRVRHDLIANRRKQERIKYLVAVWVSKFQSDRLPTYFSETQPASQGPVYGPARKSLCPGKHPAMPLPSWTITAIHPLGPCCPLQIISNCELGSLAIRGKSTPGPVFSARKSSTLTVPVDERFGCGS